MFLNKGLIGQQKEIELFNNIGNFGDYEGRLTVWLALNQIPNIYWEFEVARGERSFEALLQRELPRKLTSWDGSDPQFILEEATRTYQGGHRYQFRGYAEKAFYGDMNAKAHYFDFYLPNTGFFWEATDGRLAEMQEAFQCESFTAEINKDWSVQISTTQEALDWLEPVTQNRGSMITAKFHLFQTKQPTLDVQKLLSLTLYESNQLLSELCNFLSFVNGGYIHPVYAIARKIIHEEKDQPRIEDVASLVEIFLIDPQEKIGQSFLGWLSMRDLLEFFQCFQVFQRMIETPHWREKWVILLEWYFQAIPKAYGRGRSALPPVIANSLGTLLENLARIILVDEEQDSIKRGQNEKLKARSRIKALLNRLGISGEDSNVDYFIDIRNNSTHANQEAIPLTEHEQWKVILQAIQWADEVILWRLGYRGQYRERNGRLREGIQPRYDLTLRDPNW